jgi:hypothetical protein
MDAIEKSVRATDVIPADACSVQVAMDGVMVPTDGDDAARRGRKTDSPDPARHEQKYGSRSGPMDPAAMAEDAPTDDATRRWPP